MAFVPVRLFVRSKYTHYRKKTPRMFGWYHTIDSRFIVSKPLLTHIYVEWPPGEYCNLLSYLRKTGRNYNFEEISRNFVRFDCGYNLPNRSTTVDLNLALSRTNYYFEKRNADVQGARNYLPTIMSAYGSDYSTFMRNFINALLGAPEVDETGQLIATTTRRQPKPYDFLLYYWYTPLRNMYYLWRFYPGYRWYKFETHPSFRIFRYIRDYSTLFSSNNIYSVIKSLRVLDKLAENDEDYVPIRIGNTEFKLSGPSRLINGAIRFIRLVASMDDRFNEEPLFVSLPFIWAHCNVKPLYLKMRVRTT